MSSTFKYLKETGLTFANRRETAKSPSRLSGLIAGALSNCGNSVYAYTDGSTNPKINHPNSGCGVVLTNMDHKIIWQGGMIVRADGNNFIPELAAVSCVIKALPQQTSMILRTDSMAVIGAISKGALSERKRGEQQEGPG